MSRAFKIIAAVSLAINVLAFGYAAGLLVHHSPMEILTRKQHHLLDLLPVDQAKALNPVLVKGLDEQREAIARIHDLRSRLLQLMRAETYDETAFRSALQDLERECARRECTPPAHESDPEIAFRATLRFRPSS